MELLKDTWEARTKGDNGVVQNTIETFAKEVDDIKKLDGTPLIVDFTFRDGDGNFDVLREVCKSKEIWDDLQVQFGKDDKCGFLCPEGIKDVVDINGEGLPSVLEYKGWKVNQNNKTFCFVVIGKKDAGAPAGGTGAGTPSTGTGDGTGDSAPEDFKAEGDIITLKDEQKEAFKKGALADGTVFTTEMFINRLANFVTLKSISHPVVDLQFCESDGTWLDAPSVLDFVGKLVASGRVSKYAFRFAPKFGGTSNRLSPYCDRGTYKTARYPAHRRGRVQYIEVTIE